MKSKTNIFLVMLLWTLANFIFWSLFIRWVVGL
jgi:hypothetical protein